MKLVCKIFDNRWVLSICGECPPYIINICLFTYTNNPIFSFEKYILTFMNCVHIRWKCSKMFYFICLHFYRMRTLKVVESSNWISWQKIYGISLVTFLFAFCRNEKREGLASRMKIKCHQCSHVHLVDTCSKPLGKRYADVNLKLAVGWYWLQCPYLH